MNLSGIVKPSLIFDMLSEVALKLKLFPNCIMDNLVLNSNIMGSFVLNSDILGNFVLNFDILGNFVLNSN